MAARIPAHAVACVAVSIAFAALTAEPAATQIISPQRIDANRALSAPEAPRAPEPVALTTNFPAASDRSPAPPAPGRDAAAEPFGAVTVPVTGGGLWAKWRGVAAAIEAESGMLARCRADPGGCPSAAAVRFLAIIDAARARQGRARLGEVNRAINLAIRPVSDLDQYGVPDLWSSPLATLAAGAGDCEDYAIAKYVALREAGVADGDVRLLIVHDEKRDDDHAVVTARLDGRWLVLDNRWLVMLADAELTAYRPLFAIDGGGVHRLVRADRHDLGDARRSAAHAPTPTPAPGAPLPRDARPL